MIKYQKSNTPTRQTSPSLPYWRGRPLAVSLFIAALMLVSGGTASAQYTTIAELPVLTGGSQSWAWHISNNGNYVAGRSDNSSGILQPVGWASPSYSVSQIPLPAGYVSGQAWAVNSLGNYVGQADHLFVGYRYAFVSIGGGTASLLPTLKGNSVANGINGSNVKCGNSRSSSGTTNYVHWTSTNTIQDKGLYGGGSYANCQSIAANGWSVGSAFDSASNSVPVYVPSGGTSLSALPVPAGSSGFAYAIAQTVSGSAVAGFATDSSGNTQAVLWLITSGTPSSAGFLGTLGGANSWGYGVNVFGDVVGASQNSSGQIKAFIRTSGVMKDLNTLLPSGTTGWDLQYAMGINTNGDIVGMGMHNGNPRGFLLSP